MVIRWGVFFTKSRTALKTGWLITAGVVALYLGAVSYTHLGTTLAAGRSTMELAREPGAGAQTESGQA